MIAFFRFRRLAAAFGLVLLQAAAAADSSPEQQLEQARAAVALDDAARAEALLREAAAGFKALSAAGEAQAQRLLAETLAESGHAAQALAAARRAVALLEPGSDRAGLALAQSALAQSFAANDRPADALAVSRRAVAAAEGQSGEVRIPVLLRHAELLQKTGNHAAAVQLLRRELRPLLPADTLDPAPRQRWQRLLAQSLSAQGSAAEAAIAWNEALRLAERRQARLADARVAAEHTARLGEQQQAAAEIERLRSEKTARSAWFLGALVLLAAAGAGAAWAWRRRMDERLAAAASHDALTGIPNRTSGLAAGQAAFAAARALRQPLAVLRIDIDSFKRVNALHGHAAGDEVLRQVAALLGQGLRRSDLLARWGGEQFLLLLPGAPAHEAWALAERQRAGVSAAAIRAQAGADPLRVTASVGLAAVADDDAGLEAAIARAESALARAKQEGRDRVVAEGESAPAAAPSAPRRAAVPRAPAPERAQDERT